MPFLRGTRYALLGSETFSPLSLSGLLAWWSLEDGSGETAVDSSGNGYDLTLSNTPTWISGQKRGALHFTAANSEKGETGAAALLASLQGSNTFTVAFMARAAAYAALNTTLAIRNGTVSTTFLGVCSHRSTNGNGVLVFWNGNPIIDQDVNAASVDEWHLYAFVSRSATDHEMFVDNVSVGTSSASNSLSSTLSHVTIGAWNGGQFFDGDMDEVMIFDRDLTSSELTQLYQWTEL